MDYYWVSPRTLCFVVHRDEVLLLRGAPDKAIWAGRYNGVGGHVKPDEDVRAAALREIREETGLTVQDLKLRGIVNIPGPVQGRGVILFVFTARAPGRAVRASREGTPTWVAVDKVDQLNLVPDLQILLPRVLSMGPHTSPFYAVYAYDEEGQLVVSFAAEQPE